MFEFRIIENTAYLTFASPLYLAVMRGDLAAIKALIADPNTDLTRPVAYHNGYPVYLLFAAISSKNDAIINLLMDKGLIEKPFSFDLSCGKFKTVQEQAVACGLPFKIIYTLFKQIPSQSKNNHIIQIKLLLLWLMEYQRTDCLRDLIQSNELREFCFKNKETFNALCIAFTIHETLLPLLVPYLTELEDKSWLSQTLNPNYTLLGVATAMGNEALVTDLLNLGMSAADGPTSSQQMPAQFIAMNTRNFPILKLLYQRGASAHQCLITGGLTQSAVAYAISNSSKDIIEFMTQQVQDNLIDITLDETNISVLDAYIAALNEEALLALMPKVLLVPKIGIFLRTNAGKKLLSLNPDWSVEQRNLVYFSIFSIMNHLDALFEYCLRTALTQLELPKKQEWIRIMFCVCCDRVYEAAWILLLPVMGESIVLSALTSDNLHYALMTINSDNTAEDNNTLERIILPLLPHYVKKIPLRTPALASRLAFFRILKTLYANEGDEQAHRSLLSVLFEEACNHGAWDVILDLADFHPSFAERLASQMVAGNTALLHQIKDPELLQKYMQKGLEILDPGIRLTCSFLVLLKFFCNKDNLAFQIENKTVHMHQLCDTAVSDGSTSAMKELFLLSSDRKNSNTQRHLFLSCLAPLDSFSVENNDCAVRMLTLLETIPAFSKISTDNISSELFEVTLKSLFSGAVAIDNLDGLTKIHHCILKKGWMSQQKFNEKFLVFLLYVGIVYQSTDCVTWLVNQLTPSLSLHPTDILHPDDTVEPNATKIKLWDLLDELFKSDNDSDDVDHTYFRVVISIYESRISDKEKSLAKKLILKHLLNNPALLKQYLAHSATLVTDCLEYLTRPSERLYAFLINYEDDEYAEAVFLSEFLTCFAKSKIAHTLYEVLIQTIDHNNFQLSCLLAHAIKQHDIPEPAYQNTTPLSVLTRRFWHEHHGTYALEYARYFTLLTQYLHCRFDPTTLNAIALALVSQEKMPENRGIDAAYMFDPLKQLLGNGISANTMISLTLKHQATFLIPRLAMLNVDLVDSTQVQHYLLNAANSDFLQTLLALFDLPELCQLFYKTLLSGDFNRSFAFLNRCAEYGHHLFPIGKFDVLQLGALFNRVEWMDCPQTQYSETSLRKTVNNRIKIPHHHQPFINQLLKKRDSHLTSGIADWSCLQGLTAIEVAVILNHTEAAQRLFALAPNVTQFDVDQSVHPSLQGSSLLAYACRANNEIIVRQLLSFGVSPLFAGILSSVTCIELTNSTGVKTTLMRALDTQPRDHTALSHLSSLTQLPISAHAAFDTLKSTASNAIDSSLQLNVDIQKASDDLTTFRKHAETIETQFLSIDVSTFPKLMVLKAQLSKEIKSLRKLSTKMLQFTEWQEEMKTLEACQQKMLQLSQNGNRLQQIPIYYEIAATCLVVTNRLKGLTDNAIAWQETVNTAIASLKQAHKSYKEKLRCHDLMPSRPASNPATQSSTAALDDASTTQSTTLPSSALSTQPSTPTLSPPNSKASTPLRANSTTPPSTASTTPIMQHRFFKSLSDQEIADLSESRLLLYLRVEPSDTSPAVL